MKMKFSLELKQQQKLIMTPELRQSIEILELNSKDLWELIDEELLTNPVLESYTRRPYQSTNYYLDNIDTLRIPQLQTLRAYLQEQLAYVDVDSPVLEIANFLIESINSKGYLNIGYEEIKQITHANNFNKSQLDTALEIVRGLNPTGVGAYDLKDCLILQSSKLGKDAKITEKFIDNHLNDLAENKISKIAKSLNISVPKAQRIARLIKKMNPKPGASYGESNNIHYIVPDAIIKNQGGQLSLIVTENSAPVLNVGRQYLDVYKKTKDKKVLEYIKERIRSAKLLIKNIDKRRDTIYRICEHIMQVQHQFFLSDNRKKASLESLTQKEAADALELHESTISRAISGKYIECETGIYPMNHFFQLGVKNIFGDNVSVHNIKSLITRIIENEDPTNPLSDQKILRQIKLSGINISRRTISKYRHELGYGPKSLRKR